MNHLKFFALPHEDHLVLQFNSIRDEKRGQQVYSASYKNFHFMDIEEKTKQKNMSLEEILNYITKAKEASRGIKRMPKTVGATTRREMVKSKEFMNLNRYKLRFTKETHNVYKECKRSGAYGFKEFIRGEILQEIDSFDKKSCYSSLLVSKEYPASKAILIENPTQETIDFLIKHDKLFIIQFETPNGGEECWMSLDYIRNRKALSTPGIIYKSLVWHAKKEKLPRSFINDVILGLFEKKESATTPSERNYYKMLLNTIHGNTEMDPVRYGRDFDDPKLISMMIGLWTCAYARAEMWDVIHKIGEEKVYYWDTDGFKCRAGAADEIIKEENKRIREETENELLGQWVKEGDSQELIVFGNKQYWYNNKLVCAGLDGTRATKWLLDNKLKPHMGMKFPAEVLTKRLWDRQTKTWIYQPYTLGNFWEEE